MKLTNSKQVDKFLETVNRCEGQVWLQSQEGDTINLKSQLSKYVAISALLSENGENLELFCVLPEDELRFYDLFDKHPEILGQDTQNIGD